MNFEESLPLYNCFPRLKEQKKNINKYKTKSIAYIYLCIVR